MPSCTSQIWWHLQEVVLLNSRNQESYGKWKVLAEVRLTWWKTWSCLTWSCLISFNEHHQEYIYQPTWELWWGLWPTMLWQWTFRAELATVCCHNPWRIHGAGIYANIGGILMVNVTMYIAYMGPMAMGNRLQASISSNAQAKLAHNGTAGFDSMNP